MATMNDLITSWYLRVVNALSHEDDGQGLVEYALIIAVVAVMLVAALITLRTGISNTFNNITNHLSSGS